MALTFLKRLGIENGKPFRPDARQSRILLEAERKGFDMSVAHSAAREMDDMLKHATFYEGTNWSNPLTVTSLYSTIDEERRHGTRFAQFLDARGNLDVRGHEGGSPRRGL